MKIKPICYLIALSLLAGLLSGCGNKTPQSSAISTTTTVAPTTTTTTTTTVAPTTTTTTTTTTAAPTTTTTTTTTTAAPATTTAAATAAPVTPAPTTTKRVSSKPNAAVPPLQGGLTAAQREELYKGLRDIIAKNGSNYMNVYNYVHGNKVYRYLAEGKSIEQMAYYTMVNRSVSCYYFAAFTYLLMKEAGYEVEFVRGLGWQNGTEHCWIMFKEADGWYFMDSLYVRSAKLTKQQCLTIGYKWDASVHPAAK